MKNRKIEGIMVVKTVIAVAVMVIGLIGAGSVVKSHKEVTDAEANLPANFAVSQHPLKLNTELYYISETAAFPTLLTPLKEIPDDGYAIQVIPVVTDPNPFYARPYTPVVSKIIKDRSVANGYFVVRSLRNDNWRYLTAEARLASKK